MRNILILTVIIFIGGTVVVSSLSKGEKKEGTVQLIVRGDDIGSFHAANLGCIKSYKEGIMRSVEVMVPCAWYEEAVVMLNNEPGLDVGIHLVLNSEWENVKWGPVSGISSITHADGYFFPMVWPNDNFPPERAFRESGWQLDDVENELRIQIELAKRDIKNVTHVTSHMGFTSASPAIDSLVRALSAEYGLIYNTGTYKVKRMKFDKPEDDSKDARIKAFIESLQSLESGTYLFVEHPALDTPEMESVGHKGYCGVGRDRQLVTDMFTSPEIMKEIKMLGIELISYADLQQE